jgi:hypothetical protein
MYFRTYLLAHNIELTSFTLDASGTSYFNRGDDSIFGLAPVVIDEAFLETPVGTQFAAKNVTEWISKCEKAMPPRS